MNFLLCLHVEIISALEFSNFSGSALEINSFSVKQISHFLDPHMYGAAVAAISHEMLNFLSCSLSDQMYCDSLVSDPS